MTLSRYNNNNRNKEEREVLKLGLGYLVSISNRNKPFYFIGTVWAIRI